MKIEMVALKPFTYGGKRLKPGQRFEVKGQSDARLLRALDRAADFSPPVFIAPLAVKPRRVEVRPAVIETAPAVEPAVSLEVEAPEAEPRAEEAPEPKEKPAPVEPEAEPDVSLRTGKPKRQYRRRDMTSEG